MVIAKDYDETTDPRTTAVSTLDEMVVMAKRHPEMWRRRIAERAERIAYAQSLPYFDPVILEKMIENQKRHEEALKLAEAESV